MALTLRTVINQKIDKMKLGIKALSLENWISPDPLMCNLVMHNKDNGMISIMSGDDWALSILEPKPAETVPIEILKLFEVARGSMLYGYFFYPLYTLALEQCYRVAEAAITEKCNQLNAPKKAKTFKDRLVYLHKTDVISKLTHDNWNAIRELRNSASHPKEQTILTPGMALGMLFQIADEVNSLFGGCIKVPEQVASM